MALKVNGKEMNHVVFNDKAIDLLYYQDQNHTKKLYGARPFTKTSVESEKNWYNGKQNIGSISYSLGSPNLYQNDRNNNLYYYGDTIKINYKLITPGFFINASLPDCSNRIVTANIGESFNGRPGSIASRGENSTLTAVYQAPTSITEIVNSVKSTFSVSGGYEQITTSGDFTSTGTKGYGVPNLGIKWYDDDNMEILENSYAIGSIIESPSHSQGSFSSQLLPSGEYSYILQYRAGFKKLYYHGDPYNSTDNNDIMNTEDGGEPNIHNRPSIRMNFEADNNTKVYHMHIEHMRGQIAQLLGHTGSTTYNLDKRDSNGPEIIINDAYPLDRFETVVEADPPYGTTNNTIGANINDQTHLLTANLLPTKAASVTYDRTPSIYYYYSNSSGYYSNIEAGLSLNIKNTNINGKSITVNLLIQMGLENGRGTEVTNGYGDMVSSYTEKKNIILQPGQSGTYNPREIVFADCNFDDSNMVSSYVITMRITVTTVGVNKQTYELNNCPIIGQEVTA